MKTVWLLTLVAALVLALAPGLSDAARLGGSKSIGMQRNMPARTAPDAPPAPPAAPVQATPGTPTPVGAVAATPPRSSWMGPLAGVAAGLGLAALMSHFGLGEGFADVLLVALLVAAGFFVVRLLLNRLAGGPRPAGALAGSDGIGRATQVAWPPAGNQAPASPAAASVARAFVPAAFDGEGFARIAKTIFIRMQAANDAGDLDDLRRFTTPEMYAELRMDLQDRGALEQRTDVVHVDAEVLDVAEDGQRQIVSVRFHGQVREQAGAAATAFDEVWHLVKSNGDGGNWAIAGIEQQPARA